MRISEVKTILESRQLNAKGKVKLLADKLLSGEILVEDILEMFPQSKAPAKGSLMEVLEFTTREQPEIFSSEAFTLVIDSMYDKTHRVKWEAGKVIANTARHYPEKLSQATEVLLRNATDESTVVRWSVATALAEISKINTALRKRILDEIPAITRNEKKNSILKIYSEMAKG